MKSWPVLLPTTIATSPLPSDDIDLDDVVLLNSIVLVHIS